MFILTVFVFTNCAYAAKLHAEHTYFEKQKYCQINLCFWEKFGDKYLTNYIIEALENNHTARANFHKSQQFRQEINSAFARQLPKLKTDFNYVGVKIPRLDNFDLTQQGIVLPFELNWEADLLGKNADRTKSKRRLFWAQKYDEFATNLMLVSDVGTTYINILKYDKMIEIQENELKNLEKILEKNTLLSTWGIISKTDLNNKKIRINSAKIRLENLKKGRKVLLNSLCLLVGRSPFCSDELERGKFEDFGLQIEIPDCISTHALYSRPDLKSALEKLASAQIDIKVAKKEFFPSFNISGFYTFNSFGPGNFFSWEAIFAAFILGATQDIFTGGKKLANLRLKKARYKELLEEFLQKDLEAIKEVNDALYRSKYDLAVLELTKDKLKLKEENLSFDDLRFKQGGISELDLIELRNEKIEIERDFVDAKSLKFINLVSLYKATGGQI